MPSTAHYPRVLQDKRPVAIDIYNNSMSNFHDNAVEIDGSMHNVRVMRNMMQNRLLILLQSAAIGGPIY
jgi:hypothetical protein